MLSSNPRLNIGCGYITHPDWTNLDLVPTHSIVHPFDFRRGLPAPSDSIEACYSSHVLEHAQPEEATFLVQECFRVLRSGGIIRLVVPDLEAIARLYLQHLEQALIDDSDAALNYDWMVLELLDQGVRDRTGGRMAQYLNQFPQKLPNEAFVANRWGFELENYRSVRQRSFKEKLLSKRPAFFLQKFRQKLAEVLVYLIAGQQARQGFKEGLFRQSGEIHRWMYDRYSLTRLLETTGFTAVQVCAADESRIPNFVQYNLDTLDGRIRKPDSLFIEAIKP